MLGKHSISTLHPQHNLLPIYPHFTTGSKRGLSSVETALGNSTQRKGSPSSTAFLGLVLCDVFQGQHRAAEELPTFPDDPLLHGSQTAPLSDEPQNLVEQKWRGLNSPRGSLLWRAGMYHTGELILQHPANRLSAIAKVSLPLDSIPML